MSASVPVEIRTTIEAVACLPRTLHSRGDVSAYAILAKSGYFDRHEDVTPVLLAETLARDVSLVDDWLAFSANKRTSTGWFFYEEGTGFTVGFLGIEGNQVGEYRYTDRIEACAEFIKREVEEIRLLG